MCTLNSLVGVQYVFESCVFVLFLMWHSCKLVFLRFLVWSLLLSVAIDISFKMYIFMLDNVCYLALTLLVEMSGGNFRSDFLPSIQLSSRSY